MKITDFSFSSSPKLAPSHFPFLTKLSAIVNHLATSAYATLDVWKSALAR
jgi:hypothetical protein